jgi:hypothetical protein
VPKGAVVRRLVGYARFDGIETARVMARLYAAARVHLNFFQPSFKLKEKRREGVKVITRYHAPATPYARALAHPKLSQAINRRLREIYRDLDLVALLEEIRAAQEQFGERIQPMQAKCVHRIASASGFIRRVSACLRGSIRTWQGLRLGSQPRYRLRMILTTGLAMRSKVS